jgi:hypothetical protein
MKTMGKRTGAPAMILKKRKAKESRSTDQYAQNAKFPSQLHLSRSSDSLPRRTNQHGATCAARFACPSTENSTDRESRLSRVSGRCCCRPRGRDVIDCLR